MAPRHWKHLLYQMPSRIPDGEFRILAYLCNYADVTGGAIYPDKDRLAHQTGLNRGYVGLALKRFMLRGWLQQYSGATGKARWRLALPVENPVENPTQTVENPGGSDPGIDSRDPGIDSRDPGIARSSNRSDSRLSDLSADREATSPSYLPLISLESLSERGNEPEPTAASPTADELLEEARSRIAMLKARLNASPAKRDQRSS